MALRANGGISERRSKMVSTPTALASQDHAVGEFLDRLRRLVLDEALTTKQNLLEVWSQPLANRVRQGRAIEGLRITKVRPDGRIVLGCERNASRFREGDILKLNRGNPFFQPAFQVMLEVDDGQELVVQSREWALNWGEVLGEKTGWVLDEDNLDLSPYFLDALNCAADSTVGRERILPLLMGRIRPRVDPVSYDRACDLAEHYHLNDSQAEAFALAYATDLAYLIQGPPGTGKTRVLAHLAQTLAADGERVLITAFTHRAINNALNKLAEVAPDTPAIKIGEPSRADGLLVENYEGFGDSPFAEMSDGYVIGATPFATRSQRLGGVEFETVIFDEASQITLPLAIMGMLSAKRYIFIGDHQQLPPVLITRHGDEALRASVFGALVERGFDAMLTESYRLSAELARWPSEQFYQNQLKPTPEAAGRRVAYAMPPRRWTKVLDPDRPKVFVDLLHRNTTIRSHTEADVVVSLIATLVKAGISPDEIGVVTPYRAQAREIRSLLRPMFNEAEQRRRIVIDTVERMQGQERDVIIFSLATSNPVFASQVAEFFFQPQRLNVAITRPRKKLIIVGSSHVLHATEYLPGEAPPSDMLDDLLASCHTFVPDYVA